MPAAIKIIRIRAFREDTSNPDMSLYDQLDASTLANLAVAKVIAQHQPITPPKKEEVDMTNITAGKFRGIPARLDAEACLKVLAQITDAKTESVSAARGSIDVEAIDAALEIHNVSIDDRWKFKHQLAEFGIISSGRRFEFPRA
jgi:hypothetical protein